jgi:thiol-disulfide isomerase/thioredoxin
MKTLALMLAPVACAFSAGLAGMWDAVIITNGVRVPFRMELTEQPARACFFEDTEPVCSTSARVEKETLVASWDFLKRELHVSLKGSDLAGSYRAGNREVGAIEATRKKPVPPAAQPPAKVDGTWEVHPVEGRTSPGRLLLRQNGAELKGTILKVSGDVGTLVGRISGNQFRISHFAGDRPTLLEGTVLPDGTLSLVQNNLKLFAVRPAEARARKLPQPADSATFAKARNPAEKFRFSFPDLNGKRVTEAAFAGKPLVVSVTGSWCPNCRDEAPFLAELYAKYRGQGLEIVGLCFETGDDPSYASLRAFIKKYDIRYPMLLAGEPENLKTAVPQIENISAFPTTIYVGRDGRVHRVHTGFPSAGSGEEQARVKKEIRATVEELISGQASKQASSAK